MHKNYNLEDRLVNFAADITRFVKGFLNDSVGKYYQNQLIRSAGSSALNFGEAQGAITVKDFIHKLSISIKELKESRVSLKILQKVNYGNLELNLKLLDEVEQLIRILSSIIKKKRALPKA